MTVAANRPIGAAADAADRRPSEAVISALSLNAWNVNAWNVNAWSAPDILLSNGRLTETIEFEFLLDAAPLIPARYWNAKPLADGGADADARLTGAVLVRVTASTRRAGRPVYGGRSREVAAAVAESRPAPFRRLLGYLRRESALTFALNASMSERSSRSYVSLPLARS